MSTWARSLARRSARASPGAIVWQRLARRAITASAHSSVSFDFPSLPSAMPFQDATTSRRQARSEIIFFLLACFLSASGYSPYCWRSQSRASSKSAWGTSV
jgi:hypothetical protein